MSWRHNTDSNVTTIPEVAPATPPGDSGPPPLSKWRTLLVVAVFVALIGGIVAVVTTRDSGGDSNPGNAATTGSLPAQQTTLAPSQTATPPRLVNTGEDWDAIARSIVAFNDWLYAHPQPELLDNIMVPTDKDYPDTKLGLTNLATKGWRYDPPVPPTLVERVSVTTRMSPTRVGVVLRYGPAPRFRVIDSAGNVIQDKPAGTDGNTVEWTLVQTPGDARWRLESVIPL